MTAGRIVHCLWLYRHKSDKTGVRQNRTGRDWLIIRKSVIMGTERQDLTLR